MVSYSNIYKEKLIEEIKQTKKDIENGKKFSASELLVIRAKAASLLSVSEEELDQWISNFKGK